MALSEKQVQKRSPFLRWKGKGKKNGSFLKQHRSDYHLNSSRKVSHLASAKHDSLVALPFWRNKGTAMERHVHQQPSHPRTWQDHWVENRIHLFWVFPSLPSEILHFSVHVLGDYSSVFTFRRITNIPTGQLYPVLSNAFLPSLPGVQPHPFPQSLPPSQLQRLSQIRLLVHLQCTIPNVPSGPIPRIGICGEYFHHLHSESDDSTSSIIQYLGWHLLCHQLEHLWGLPSVAQSSQEDFCSSRPNSAYHRPSQAQVSISILPGAFPLINELSKNEERHLRKKLIQHQWGLPRRIHESQALMRRLSDLSEISELDSNYELSYISVYKGQSTKMLNVGLSPPRSFCERGSEMQHLEEDMGKAKGNSLENGPEDPVLGDSDSSSDEALMYGSEEELDGPGVSPSDSLTDEALLTHTEGVSSVDVGASQGLPVHVEDRGVRMEQRQEPWGPRWVFRWYRKKVLQAQKRLSPQGPTSEVLGGGDPGLGTSQTRCLGRSKKVQDVAVEEVLGSKSSQTTSQKGQSALESPFRKQIKRLLPCLQPDREGKKQENPQATGSPISCAQSRGPVQGRDALPGTTRNKKVRRGFGSYLREKRGRQPAADIPCPQDPFPPL
ncbi:spermatogenesis-associated protein 31D4-like isoform X1 [Rhinolophus sinicus]|uniref:spermatogenesis-associated protein 31D4-like isoform X1 n=1 Tax=Rhinolophus sinicus TaxID=89399 RepID=UPI003D798CA4